jgi:hypothetical protein
MPTSSRLDPPDRRVQLLVARMGVAGGRERARMPSEALGQVEVLCGPVDVRDGRVAQGVEGVERLGSGSIPKFRTAHSSKESRRWSGSPLSGNCPRRH